MKYNKFLNIFLISALFMQTFFFQVALPSLVLCFGEDGHIAFEWNDNSRQCELDERIQVTDFNKEITNLIQNPEAGCTDINLHLHVSFAEKSKNKKYPTISTESLFQNYISYTETINKYTFIKLQRTTDTKNILETIQSTVLII